MNAKRNNGLRMPRQRRRGMSLLEVILATAILVSAVMALSRLAFLAARHAIGCQDQTRAQLLCQSIMEELISGIRPLQNVSTAPVEEYEQWVYSVDVEPLPNAPLIVIRVTVARLPDNEEGALPGDEEVDGYRLVRWVRSGGRGIQDLEMSESGSEDSLWSDQSSPFGTSEEDL